MKASVKGPSTITIQRVGGAGLKRTRAYGRGSTLGGTRHAAVISARNKEKFNETFLVLLDKVGESWRLQHRLMIAEQTMYGNGGDGCAARVRVRMTAQDFDWDGKPEVRLLYRLCQEDTSRMRGDWENLYLQIYNVEGQPRIALPQTQIEDCQSDRNRAYARHRDLNGDGHPDVVVKTVGIEGGPLKFFYDPATDRYAQKPTPAADQSR